jgi:hypothetical protein
MMKHELIANLFGDKTYEITLREFAILFPGIAKDIKRCNIIRLELTLEKDGVKKFFGFDKHHSKYLLKEKYIVEK